MARYPRPDDLASIVAELLERVYALEHPAAVRAGTTQLGPGNSVVVYSPAITPESTILVSYYQTVGPGPTFGPLVQDHSTPGRMTIVSTGSPGDISLVCWAIVD